MNIYLSIIGQLCCGLAVLMLGACGEIGIGNSSSGPKSSGAGGAGGTVLSGLVADGYLQGAKVFLDRNNNRQYDNGEPTTVSTAGGAFTLEVNPGEGNLYPVVVQVIAGQTVDEDTGLTVAEDYLLEAPKGRWQFISPLTRMVKLVRDKNPSFTELQAILKVRSELGINDNVSLFEDYLAHGSGGSDATDPQLAAEYTRAHKAARVVAALMGRLQKDIDLNLGGVADNEQDAVAYMISDKVMEQAAVIKQALDKERNNDQMADVANLVATTTSAVDPTELNANLLNRYNQRIIQNLPHWDMQPPELISSTPPTDDTTAVDVTVGAIFDEALDETMLSDDLIVLYGPNGYQRGSVSYDPDEKKLTFTPDQLLLPFSDYQVTVRKDLADSLGNTLKKDLSWSFKTTFNQTPPPLPDF